MLRIITIKKASAILLAFFVFISPVFSADTYLSIIIDDIGDHYKNGLAAINIPAPITYALLPYSQYAKKLSSIGQNKNKEFILHTPMQSVDSRLQQDHTLHIHMTKQQVSNQLTQQLKLFPFVKGINNHMGSLLTMHPGYMKIVMQTLKQHGSLFFIDSRTTSQTVATKIAQENNIATLDRDIFLDPVNNNSFINQQFDQAIALSQKNGYAIAIAHPYPETIKVLKQRLSTLNKNIKLVPVSTLIKKYTEPRHEKSIDTLSAGL